MNIEKNVEELKNFLLNKEYDDKPTDINIYYYDASGFRISEISYTWRDSRGVYGASWMRCDEGSSTVILAAEDFVVWKDVDNDLFEEAKDKLDYFISR